MIASAATARSPHRPVLIAALMIIVATAFWTRVSKLSVEAWDSPISAAAVKATDFNGTVIVLSWTDCSADDGDRHARHFTQSAARYLHSHTTTARRTVKAHNVCSPPGEYAWKVKQLEIFETEGWRHALVCR